MQIIPHVYLVNGFPYGYQQNSYVVKIDDSQILIDSGDLWQWDPMNAFESIQSNCRSWGIEPENLSHLLITHAHFDHSSHAAKWQRMGVKIVSGEDTADAMASGDDRCIGYAVNRDFEPCKVDIMVADGQELECGKITVRCISAPGHAKGCLIYEIQLNEKKLWFVGDVVVVNENSPYGLVGQLGFRGSPDFENDKLIKTLRRMYQAPFDCLFSGHGHPCLQHAKQIVGQAYTQAMCELR